MRGIMNRFVPFCRITAVLLIIALQVGCGEKPAAAPKTKPPSPAKVETPRAPGIADISTVPLTEEECLAYGKQLSAAVQAGDEGEVVRILGLDDLAGRSTNDLDLPAVHREQAIAGLQAGFSQNFARQLIQQNGQEESYRVLRIRTVGDSHRVLMRVAPMNGGTNYHEIHLVRNSQQEVVAEDIYIFFTGEFVSQSLRRLTAAFISEQTSGVLEKLFPNENIYTDNLPLLVGMFTAQKEGNPALVVECFEQLPAELQQEKGFHLLALMASQKINDEVYQRLLADYLKNHPRDSSAILLSIDSFLLAKKYELALKAIDRLDEAVGGDPHLHSVRSGVLLQAGRFAEAKKSAELAISQDPTHSFGYWMRISIALQERDFSEVDRQLRKMILACRKIISPEDIEAVPDYAPFAASPEFEAFEKWFREQP